MYSPYGPFFAVITEILPSNVAAGAIALINSFGALGSFAGSYLVGYLNGSTGGFRCFLYFYGRFFIAFSYPDDYRDQDNICSEIKVKVEPHV